MKCTRCVLFSHLRAFRSFYCHNNNNNDDDDDDNNDNIFFNDNNVELDSRLPLAACGPEQDHKAIYNLVPLLPKRGIYIRVDLYLYQLFFLFFIFPAGYSSCPGNRYDSQAFLFSLVNKPGWAPVKLPQTGLYSSNRYSIYDCSSQGPTFGNGWDLNIADQASSSRNSYAYLGDTYSPPSGYNHGDTFTRTFLPGGNGHHFTPDEVETFYETT